MKIEEIKELMQALEQSNLTSLEVVEGDSCVRMEKQCRIMETVATTASAVETAVPVQEVQSAAPVTAKPAGTPVKCPLVGVFYAAPSPEDAPFVTVGTNVKKGDVLCIVEAMKLMNEITAERDGVITEVCVNNGDVVEYGQPLFRMQ